MSGPPRDWDKELAEIDRAMEEQGVARPPVPARSGGTSPPPDGSAAPAATRRTSVALTWFWVLLAVALAVALPLWPYQRACGLQAVFFLGAAGVTAIVGGLAAVSSWKNRRAFAHVLALLVVAWAAAVAASEVLPRIGYAREVKTWTCAAEPAPAPTAEPVPGAAAP